MSSMFRIVWNRCANSVSSAELKVLELIDGGAANSTVGFVDVGLGPAVIGVRGELTDPSVGFCRCDPTDPSVRLCG